MRKEKNMKKLAKKLLEVGYKNQVSDLYILPKSSSMYDVSFRKHHDMTSYDLLSYKTAEQLILYFKYLAGMDIAEKRKVQMGGTTIKVKKETFRIRLSVVGDFLNRETLVIRFLYPMSSKNLQFVDDNQIEKIKNQITRNGLFLFSGPTGSGKSTTMHLLMQYLIRQENKHIITIEDPVEIEDVDCLQFQVNEKIGLTYQELIKVCLRHRPDCLMIGEIRDTETAQMAMRAALTGHLVFSTIHAKNRKGVEARLIELGIPREEMNQSVQGIVYQEMLPLTSGKNYGVLYDMFYKEGEDEWEKSLQKAYYEKKITQKTYQIYKN